MSKQCDVCGKAPLKAAKLTFSHKQIVKRQNPNLQEIKAVVNGVTKRIKEVNGEDVIYPSMGLSLTVDHRALDGADAARILKDIGFALENIDLLMAK